MCHGDLLVGVCYVFYDIVSIIIHGITYMLVKTDWTQLFTAFSFTKVSIRLGIKFIFN